MRPLVRVRLLQRKRKRVAVARQPMVAPTRLNEGWAIDFMSDVLSSGRRYRILNVVDVLSRESLATEVDTSLPAARVIQALEEIALERGYPARITLDNGPEFRSQALDAWAQHPGVSLDPVTYALVDPDESVRARAQELLEHELARR